MRTSTAPRATHGGPGAASRRRRLGIAGALPCLVAAMLVPAPARASEGGVNNYAIGAQSVAVAVMPPPGMSEFYGYLLWYNVRSIRDNSGASAIPEFRADFLGHAGRIVHTWNTSFFGGNVRLGSGVIYLVDYAKVKEGPRRDEDGDLSLLNIQPILVSGKVGNVFWYSGIHLYYGVGHYDPTHVANGVVHYAHYPTLTSDDALTWMPSPWFETSVNASVSANMVDHRTGYRSGSLLGVDWGMNYRPFPRLRQLSLGVGGFYAQQFTDDTLHGAKVAGARLAKSGVGPQVVWWFGPGLAAVAKWQRQYHVRNGPSGDLAWFELAFPLRIPGLPGPAGPSGGSGAPASSVCPGTACPPGPLAPSQGP